MTVIFEPAAAIAAGLCLTARTIADGRTARHDRPCGWCAYPLEELRRMVAGFEAWAERDRRDIPRRFEVVAFQSLPGRQQQALVLAAQDFPPASAEPAPQPIADPPPPPAHEPDDEGGPVWK